MFFNHFFPHASICVVIQNERDTIDLLNSHDTFPIRASLQLVWLIPTWCTTGPKPPWCLVSSTPWPDWTTWTLLSLPNASPRSTSSLRRTCASDQASENPSAAFKLTLVTLQTGGRCLHVWLVLQALWQGHQRLAVQVSVSVWIVHHRTCSVGILIARHVASEL